MTTARANQCVVIIWLVCVLLLGSYTLAGYSRAATEWAISSTKFEGPAVGGGTDHFTTYNSFTGFITQDSDGAEVSRGSWPDIDHKGSCHSYALLGGITSIVGFILLLLVLSLEHVPGEGQGGKRRTVFGVVWRTLALVAIVVGLVLWLHRCPDENYCYEAGHGSGALQIMSVVVLFMATCAICFVARTAMVAAIVRCLLYLSVALSLFGWMVWHDGCGVFSQAMGPTSWESIFWASVVYISAICFPLMPPVGFLEGAFIHTDGSYSLASATYSA
jgi:hypothetical protein